jgi:hypothetical protein
MRMMNTAWIGSKVVEVVVDVVKVVEVVVDVVKVVEVVVDVVTVDVVDVVGSGEVAEPQQTTSPVDAHVLRQHVSRFFLHLCFAFLRHFLVEHATS